MSSFSTSTSEPGAYLPAVVAGIKASYVAPVRQPTEHLPILDLDTLPTSRFWTVLGRALTLRRDNESQTEAWFVAWLCSLLPVNMIDTAGNIYVDLRTDPTHRTMFTAHTDTVHSSGGINKVHVDGKMWRASKGSALGADDGAGIAIMCHMIEAQVPGLYVFFRGEERGGIGSGWAARNMEDAFVDLDRAIAFDRADYYDVITHQSGGRCCSDNFAQALADALNSNGNWFQPCSQGVYTDTAEFTGMIPECTNISVGYKHQHGDMEYQDVDFLWELAQQCVLVQWDTLPTERNPKIRERSTYDYDWTNYRSAALESVKPSVGLVDHVAEAEADDDGFFDGTEAEALWNALELAMDNRPTLGPLLNMIAINAYPEDPSIARARINPRLLDDEALDIAMEMVDTGWPPEQVLGELWAMVSVA